MSRTTIQLRLKPYLSSSNVVVAVVTVLAIAGVVALQPGGATTNTLSLEAESGTPAGNAKPVQTPGTSGGQAVQFTAGSSGGNNCAAGLKPPTVVKQTMTLSFCDDFVGSTVDTSKWAFRSSAESDWSDSPFGTGNPGNKQLEFDRPENCTVSNGVLHITAKRQTIKSQSGQTYNWTSCLINTSESYSFRYGYIEARSQFPPVRGFWPGFWTWRVDDGNCPTDCETDAYEYYSDNKTRIYLTQLNEPPFGCEPTLPFDPTTAMHTYGVDIQPSGTKWYIDGVKMCEHTTTSAGDTYILVDNFVFGDVPPESSTTTGDKLVDYVRAWR